jgi:hypothetical protein
MSHVCPESTRSRRSLKKNRNGPLTSGFCSAIFSAVECSTRPACPESCSFMSCGAPCAPMAVTSAAEPCREPPAARSSTHSERDVFRGLSDLRTARCLSWALRRSADSLVIGLARAAAAVVAQGLWVEFGYGYPGDFARERLSRSGSMASRTACPREGARVDSRSRARDSSATMAPRRSAASLRPASPTSQPRSQPRIGSPSRDASASVTCDTRFEWPASAAPSIRFLRSDASDVNQPGEAIRTEDAVRSPDAGHDAFTRSDAAHVQFIRSRGEFRSDVRSNHREWMTNCL